MCGIEGMLGEVGRGIGEKRFLRGRGGGSHS